MNIDSIINGIVIDHIAAGRGMMLYKLLHLDRLDCSVAIIKNVHSNKMGKKDIIKVEGDAAWLKLDVLAYLDPDITVTTIQDGMVWLADDSRNLEIEIKTLMKRGEPVF